MPNEFVARNGIIALNNSVITGSLTVTNGITGSFQGTASFATTASNVQGGAANYIPLWNGATSLSSSVLYQSSGNIGIGTTSPSAKLDINGNTYIRNTFSLFVDEIKPYTGANLNLNYGASANFIITENVTERFRVSSGGNVGIGTTSPSIYSGWTGVDIRGTNGGHLIVGNTAATNRGEIFTDGNGFNISAQTNNALILKSNDTERMRITSAGNVGIGTTSPSFKVDVNGAVNTNSYFRTTDSTNGLITNTITALSTGIKLNTNAATRPITFEIDSSEKMRVHTDGNIGIGTTSPSYKLDVAGTGYYSGILSLGADLNIANTKELQWRDSIGNSWNLLYMFSDNNVYLSAPSASSSLIFRRAGYAESMRITSAGNVGIGTTSPSAGYLLDVRGRGKFVSSTGYVLDLIGSGNGQALIYTDTNETNFISDGSIKLTSSGSVRLFVSASGNIGIGTSTPTARLDVLTTSTNGIDLRNAPTTLGDQTSKSSPRLRLVSSRYEGGNVDAPFSLQNVRTGSPTNDQRLAITNFGDTEVLSILNTGNVGIGTTSPLFNLQVGANAGTIATTTLRLQNSYLDSNGNFGFNIDAVDNGVSGHDLRFLGRTSSTGVFSELVRVKNSGNVGIGTSAPSGGLDVNKTTSYFGLNGVDNYIYFRGFNNGRTAFVSNAGLSSTYNGLAIITNENNVNSLPSWRVEIGGYDGANYGSDSFWIGRAPSGSGVTRFLYINSSGNVGIGTTSPNTRLSVIGNVDLRNTAAGLGSNYGIELSTNSNTPRVSLVDNGVYSGEFFSSATIVGLKNISNNPLTFGTNNTERARITADGNLLIGTTVDVSNKLVVRGTSRIANSDGASMLYITHGATTGNTYTEVDALIGSGGGWGNLIFQSGGGNVGIGTTSPSTKLHISASTGGLLEIDGAGAAGANALYVSASGNVGIGTSTPAYKLHVVGGHVKLPNNYKLYFGDVAEALGFSIGSDGASNNMVITNNNNATLQIGTAGTSGHIIFTPNSVESVRFTGTGNVGIGTTSPNAKLEVNGNLYLSSNTNAIVIGNNPALNPYLQGDASNTLYLGTSGSARIAVLTSGNVGIGTTSPASRFFVRTAGTGSTLHGIGMDNGAQQHTWYLEDHFTSNYNIGSTAGNWKWTNSNGTLAVITATGNVGINTTSPTQKLEVNGNIKLTSGGYLYGDGSSAYLQLTNANGSQLSYGTGVYFLALAASARIRATSEEISLINNNGSIYLSGAGNVGIGTASPAAKLQVNGNTLITGSLTVGQIATGSNEHTLTVGVPLGAGVGEGGQILLAASGGLYTSASMLDNYQNKFRVLRGTNASSDGYKLQLDMHTGQMQLPNYNSVSAFTGTAIANLAVDSNGYLLTVATGSGGGGGSAFPYTGNAVISGSLNMPYTASGVIILDDPTYNNVYPSSDNYTQPQIRIRGTLGVPERTGISILKNQEVHLVSSGKGVIAARTISGVARAVMGNDVWLEWTAGETDAFVPDTTIKRIGPGMLEVTSSIKAQSFTGSLQGTSSWAVSASWAPSAGGSAPTSVTFNRVTGSYTFALTDAGKTVEVSASAAGTYNLTVPPASTTNFADGAFIDVILYGTGSIQFVTGSGVTFRSANNWTKLGTRYGAATLINIAGDEWYLIGNLNA